MQLGLLPTERVPMWAAHWIVAGYDGDSLVHLAGLHGDDPLDVRDALPGALRDCGAAVLGSDTEAAALVFTHLARMHLDGRVGPRWVSQQVEEVYIRSDYSKASATCRLAACVGASASRAPPTSGALARAESQGPARWGSGPRPSERNRVLPLLLWIEADLEVPDAGAEGVIMANADFIGVFGLWLDGDGSLRHVGGTTAWRPGRTG